MSRTIRNRHGYVWWKKNETYSIYDAQDGKENTLYSWDQQMKIARSWRRRGMYSRPNSADGRWSETGRRSGLKNETSYTRRNIEREFLVKALKGFDLDDTLYPNEKQTKHLWWSYY